MPTCVRWGATQAGAATTTTHTTPMAIEPDTNTDEESQSIGARVVDEITFAVETPTDAHRERVIHGIPQQAVDVGGRYMWGFGAEYGVCPQFIPFAVRPVNPIKILQDLADVLGATPGTAKHISRARVAKYSDTVTLDGGGQAMQLPQEYFLLHGAYPCDSISKGSSQHDHFANPSYVDQTEIESVTDTADRLEWLDIYTSLGTVEQQTVCGHFGHTSPSSMKSFTSRHDYDWRGNRLQGREYMARTWKLLTEWGYKPRDLAHAFGTTYSVVTHQIRSRAADFDPPADPTAHALGPRDDAEMAADD